MYSVIRPKLKNCLLSIFLCVSESEVAGYKAALYPKQRKRRPTELITLGSA